ncbi:MAG: type I methionyl aminopeptidase [Deltaproteobacteria bacterium]|nr:type I methionyl aminopeptidase [Deltaproteobacteria bacterium]
MDAKSRDRITLLSTAEIDCMRKAGRTAAEMLWHVASFLKPGVSTQDLDDAAVAWTTERGHTNGPLGYPTGIGTHGSFPRSICTSVNHVVCHGIPSPKEKLKDGDIINIDVSPIVDGWFGDTSRTFYVGTPPPHAKKLVEVTEECLRRGIRAVKAGGRIGDIGKAIEGYAHEQGFSVVEDFVGHGVGRVFHTAPQVPHYFRGRGERIDKGMVFTIEPMINAGRFETRTLSDNWTAITVDGKLSAQFEHTIAVTDKGVEVLTLREGDTFL